MSLFAPASLKRLGGIVAIAALLAVMTGTAGSNSAPPTTGIHGSFLERVSYFGLFTAQRWAIFATLSVIVWLLVSLYLARARSIHRGVEVALDYPRRLGARRSFKVAGVIVILFVLLILPHLVTQSFWMYLI
ncbi:MAG TPA: hypothetical protein VMF33_02310, partial [Acidimicrobiales bacterium]|nr:hypothetical protein [Acidimicrobiales bacterium]